MCRAKTGLVELSVFLLIPPLLTCSVMAARKSVKYPESKSTYTSSDGKFELFNVNHDDQDPAHTLFLRDRNKGLEIKLMSYDRWVEALWSPSGARLIVNDHGGSDFSNCLIFEPARNLIPIDVRSELEENMPSDQDVLKNHHTYIQCSDWRSADKVRVKISGYGEIDPPGFTILLDYELSGEFRLVKKERRSRGS